MIKHVAMSCKEIQVAITAWEAGLQTRTCGISSIIVHCFTFTPVPLRTHKKRKKTDDDSEGVLIKNTRHVTTLPHIAGTAF